MLNDIGNTALGLSLAVSLYGLIASIAGRRRNDDRLSESAQHAVIAAFGLSSLAAGILLVALITHDFRFEYVASYSSRDMSPLYLLTSFYAGNAGSLLFWAWLQSLLTMVVMIRGRRNTPAQEPYATAVLMGVQSFFLLLVVAVANPFNVLASPPADGRGLNPLLENIGMLIHPPALLAGYVTAAAPFALVVAGLVTRDPGGRWLTPVRNWALISWVLLGVGNVLGAQWAYVELGWGGFWAWDPVENAGLIPWLLWTAFLHTAVVERMRGMFRNWNMVLVVLTFNLTIFGTFLTRSNILQSVHTFGDTGLTPFFMAFLLVAMAGPLILIARRYRDFGSEKVLESWLSREGVFLHSSVLFLIAGMGVLLGTMFPLLVQLFTGATVNITASFFNQVDVPLFVVIITIMGICPFLVFRRSPLRQVGRSLMVPLGLGIVFGATLGIVGAGPWYVAVTFGVCLFVLAAMVAAWIKGLRARLAGGGENPLAAFGRMIWSNRPRYGGYIVHLGMVLVTIGVIGSTAFKVEQDASLKLGESMTVGAYKLTYDDLRSSVSGQKDIVTAKLSIYRGDQFIDMLFPQKLLHRNYQQPVTEVAVRSTPVEDLYVILSGWDDNRVASFKVFINPLVMWLWIGGGFLLLGALIALWPGRRLTATDERQTE